MKNCAEQEPWIVELLRGLESNCVLVDNHCYCCGNIGALMHMNFENERGPSIFPV